MRKVTHLTAVGHARRQRRVWWRRSGGLDVPADDWLTGQASRVSLGVREWCCRIGCHLQGFRRSADDLKRLSGIPVSAERLRWDIGSGPTESLCKTMARRPHEPRACAGTPPAPTPCSA